MTCKMINNQEQTAEIAKKLAELVKGGDVICLSGDLGAGKTTFTQAFAKGLNIEEPVTSPTFTILHEYHEGRIPLYHFDVYRIKHPMEMEDLGYEEYFFGNGVCVIEWATLIEEILPSDFLWIDLTVEGPQERKLCLKSTNEYYEKIVEELLK
ncbi:tRNA (adenosine(37)-N6)-threonylcarbamoyltransferase complex ATPase subunit type 1 TsaE [Alkaliphilus hydrothermalis]|uniref:tRNA threonylcarbamoyladenosine biosynthesis protein TsaE n=1 Tax=Alkaliphilus hydrothermalis TaxID=1482730 RepID=A0ABS2NR39_9FIRM|nr:tRNA (adenosine(37)-N6)-threonylcarbamoyltransferase complex ATPase subunit type 1 TsaE [Alkaliphilus hydrothermalis]MBM7615419.1 tRNA threonylcarbamoyladenosine biosynthesis protein TsaE [Alkaliphilus hydrothermalis]